MAKGLKGSAGGASKGASKSKVGTLQVLGPPDLRRTYNNVTFRFTEACDIVNGRAFDRVSRLWSMDEDEDAEGADIELLVVVPERPDRPRSTMPPRPMKMMIPMELGHELLRRAAEEGTSPQLILDRMVRFEVGKWAVWIPRPELGTLPERIRAGDVFAWLDPALSLHLLADAGGTWLNEGMRQLLHKISEECALMLPVDDVIAQLDAWCAEVAPGLVDNREWFSTVETLRHSTCAQAFQHTFTDALKPVMEFSRNLASLHVLARRLRGLLSSAPAEIDGALEVLAQVAPLARRPCELG